MTDPQAPTKDRILDAAEKLFGLNGFDVTSLRDITTDAGVNLAAVNYHFQSKDSLIDAVIGRRIEPVNRKRMELLTAAGENPSVEQILEALIRPPLELQPGPLLPLVGRILTNPVDRERLYRRHMVGIAIAFREAMQRAMPQLSEQDMVWRMHFSIGAMTHLLCWGPSLSNLTDGLCNMEDRDAVIDRAVRFLAAGFRAAATHTGKPN